MNRLLMFSYICVTFLFSSIFHGRIGLYSYIGGVYMAKRFIIFFMIPMILLGYSSYEVIYSHFTYPQFIDIPTQHNLDTPEWMTIDGTNGAVDLEIMAHYEVSAVVKSVRDYTLDYTAQISPRDFALAWGDLNNRSIDRYVKYRQRNRWYFFSVNTSAPVDITYVDEYSANTHLIPANKTIKATMKDVLPGDYVTMTGYLVNAYFDKGYWKSSLTRDDTGNGSCEIMYVTSITIHH